MVIGKEELAPIEDDGLLAKVSGLEGELDGLFAEIGVAGDDVEEGVGEAGFSHLGFAGDKGFKLRPAGGSAFALAFKKAEAAGVEKKARVFAIDLELFFLLLLAMGGGGEGGQRRAARQLGHLFIVSYRHGSGAERGIHQLSLANDLIYFQWFGGIEQLAAHLLGTDVN